MEIDKYDEIYGQITDEVVVVESFLDTFFGYLCRRTDFFSINRGLKEDHAKNVTMTVFEKWKKLARERDKQEEMLCERLQSDGVAPAAVSELELQSEETVGDASSKDNCGCTSAEVENLHTTGPKSSVTDQKVPPSLPDALDQRYYTADSDCYNGAVRDNYSWAQSITDLDVFVPVPSSVVKGKQVRVAITATSIEVSVLDGNAWQKLVDGTLCWKVNTTQTLWSLEPAKQIQIHMEKIEERWWDAILTSEPKIDLEVIDASRPLTDFGEDLEMKLQELIWNEKQKIEGMPTSDQLAYAKILEEAWDLEGSPFAGTPFDPSVLSCVSMSSDQTAE